MINQVRYFFCSKYLQKSNLTAKILSLNISKKFDLVISLYSLDYHYNFTVYKEYFKKIFDENTIIIFDTIRPNYFEDIFQEVEIIKTNKKTVHKSERIVCRKIKKEKL